MAIRDEACEIIKELLDEEGYLCTYSGQAMIVRALLRRPAHEVSDTSWSSEAWYQIANVFIRKMKIIVQEIFDVNIQYSFNMYSPDSLPRMLRVLKKIAEETGKRHKQGPYYACNAQI